MSVQTSWGGRVVRALKSLGLPGRIFNEHMIQWKCHFGILIREFVAWTCLKRQEAERRARTLQLSKHRPTTATPKINKQTKMKIPIIYSLPSVVMSVRSTEMRES